MFILYIVVKISNFVLVLLEKVSDYVDLNFFFCFLEVSHKSSCQTWFVVKTPILRLSEVNYIHVILGALGALDFHALAQEMVEK